MNKIETLTIDKLSKGKNERIIQLDIIRTFSILCVILCHSCEEVYKMINNTQDYVILSLLHTISRLGVPLFLFLSGALLLKKNIESDEDVKIFIKRIYYL